MLVFLVRINTNPSEHNHATTGVRDFWKRRSTREPADTLQQCFSESELHHHPRREEGQRATLCSLAGAQRIQAGMIVFLGDLCSAAPPLSERHTLMCAAKSGLIDHRNKTRNMIPPLMLSDGCFVLHPQTPLTAYSNEAYRLEVSRGCWAYSDELTNCHTFIFQWLPRSFQVGAKGSTLIIPLLSPAPLSPTEICHHFPGNVVLTIWDRCCVTWRSPRPFTDGAAPASDSEGGGRSRDGAGGGAEEERAQSLLQLYFCKLFYLTTFFFNFLFVNRNANKMFLLGFSIYFDYATNSLLNTRTIIYFWILILMNTTSSLMNYHAEVVQMHKYKMIRCRYQQAQADMQLRMLKNKCFFPSIWPN